MKEVEVRFGRKVRTGEYETANFEITARVEMGGIDAFTEVPGLFQTLKAEVEKEIAKFKEEHKQKNNLQPQPVQPQSIQPQPVSHTTETATTTPVEETNLPQKFSIVDPKNPEKVLYEVENGMAVDPNSGTYKGTLEPRASKTGPYYLLRNVGILTKNKNTWCLKDKQQGKWVTIGVIKKQR